MSHWNMFSEEVRSERAKVRDYGVDKIENFPGMSSKSYKQQALRELAKRLEYEEICKDLNKRLGAAIDLLDGVTENELVSLTGLKMDAIKGLMLKFKGY